MARATRWGKRAQKDRWRRAGTRRTPGNPTCDRQVPVRRCGEQGENDAETSNVEATGSERWGFGGVVLGGRGHPQRKGRMTVELTRKKVPVS